jgi:putative intracellular protease/amidase
MVPLRALLFSVFVTAAVGPARGQAPVIAPMPKAVVPVAMYLDTGAGGNGPPAMEKSFHAGTEFRITRLKADDIRAGRLKGYKVLIVPGGSGSKEGTALGADGRAEVKRFVDAGGCYVGICAGCYLASTGYSWSLDILPAKTVDRANWMRGRGDLALEITPEGRQWFRRPDSSVKTIYHNGPVLAPLPDAKGKLIPLAVYREELTKKGAKAGLMVDTPAIAAARYGKGWAIGVSPHPEQTDGLKDLVPSAIRWALQHPAEK